MTETSSGPKPADADGDDDAPVYHPYGHGRMPAFMKLAWLAFLAFAAWYVVTFLLAALSDELG